MYRKQALTPRELQVAKLLKLGMDNRQIAEVLFITYDTVKQHVQNIFSKTGYVTRSEFAAKYYKPLFPYTKSWNSEAISKKFLTGLKKV